METRDRVNHLVIVAIASMVALLVLLFGQMARADVQVVVNGQPVQFDQPPLERGGRVFVPLRGVFERLGASVVYDNGVINATGSGHNIQLTIGSTRALVDGQTQTLDQAPFVVGARTLVPLRFVSQSLGAGVQWDEGSQTVSIYGSGGAPVSQASSGVRLRSLRPGNGANVQSFRPAISASFDSTVDPNSVRITLDGRDVSSTAYVSANDFLFTPSYDLTQGSHTVDVAGKGTNGATFDRQWSFTSGGNASTNFLNNLTPANSALVSPSFTVSGSTVPYARVHLAATASQVYGGILRATVGTYSTDLVADSSGRFATQVNLDNVVSGGAVTVRVTSSDPNTGSGATATLNLRS